MKATSEVRIPPAAMPVVLVLRRDVERPKYKLSDGASCRFILEDGRRACPMQLHPKAGVIIGSGWFLSKAIGVDPTAGGAFVRWWDCLSPVEARQAVRLIWPAERKERGR